MTAMNTNSVHYQNNHGGFSLIEVLVALLVLSIGLLGLAALQTTSLQFNTGSYSRTQATLLAYDIMDRMRANSTGFTAGNYDVADSSEAGIKIFAYTGCKATTCACDTSACAASDLATYDLGQWYARLGQLLPESGTVANLATIETVAPNKRITIRWQERDLGMSQMWIVQP